MTALRYEEAVEMVAEYDRLVADCPEHAWERLYSVSWPGPKRWPIHFVCRHCLARLDALALDHVTFADGLP